MQRIDQILSSTVIKALKEIYSAEIDSSLIQIQKTKKEFEGDFTLIVFPLLRFSKKSPELSAQEIGEYLCENLDEVEGFNVIKGFLNLTLSVKYWLNFFRAIQNDKKYGFSSNTEAGKNIVIEFSSPNTNKPLHLGHIRNNLLGWSVSKIAEANGNKVTKVNLVNNRGIHICKSMLAWKKLADGKTPETENMKGDHFVGDYYVAFDKKYKEQISELLKEGVPEEDAKNKADWMLQAREMLKDWESGETEVRTLWKTMNEWVYSGFDETYKKLGVSFDKIYYESETYLKGKEIILNALKEDCLNQKEDKTVFIDLTDDGLDEKVLLRSDGTALYMTQEIGTAVIRYNDYKFDESVYVVGNEQDYHFKVLKIIMRKLGYSWAENISHLSYGMVELPHGKMKSREGNVVDADDLIEEMIQTAKEKSKELGKLDGFSKDEKNEIFRKIALGALKYFILKVDAKKNMTFNPEESIDFTGNTGPFIQYTYVRVQSMLSKAKEQGIKLFSDYQNIEKLEDSELSLMNKLYDFEDVVTEAEERRNPSVIANYVYDLAKEYNRFYHEISPILKEENQDFKKFRLSLSEKVAVVIKNALDLMGIEVPERM
ncbi:MAG: arginine--tRNA ligase [Bacteroidales bacterium]|nr:arginine--tRNA ligase [Bacteroidales bacterium]